MTKTAKQPANLASKTKPAKSAQKRSTAQLPVTQLKGVGAQLAAKLTKLGIDTLQDLLFHLPRHYADRTRITPIGKLQPQQNVVIQGTIRSVSVVFGKRRSLLCKVQDETGTISLRFYHFSNAQRQLLADGQTIRCYGETRRGASGLELYHPEYQCLSHHECERALEQTLTPIYSITEGITQQRLRSLVKQALLEIKEGDFEYLLACVQHDNIPNSLLTILQFLHSPPKQTDLPQLIDGNHPYQQMLIMEELAAYQISLLQLRKKRQQQAALTLTPCPEQNAQFIAGLGFYLTDAQQRVVNEIQQDMHLPRPMMRLLQGDVGAGKTIVAALAALQAVHNKQQVAIMAPTEILTEQHRYNFEQWFTPLGIHVGWLTGRQKAAEKRSQLERLATGTTQVIIGTHALFQADVIFNSLGLIIIDEQHRFGVHQRLTLRSKGVDTIPHQLIMTATPIPRTLAMSAYADLDYSVIDELPQGRIPVDTVIISQQKREAIIERILHACKEGRQAYWVCTLIEQSDALEAQAAEAAAQLLTQSLPELSIGLIHGRLSSSEKETVMARFMQGEIHLLVATTVIEVGVDVANASLMIIENPERLGLAQLHQLRGRVGRGSAASHCVLLYGDNVSLQGKERLKAMRCNTDGFTIAEIDLSLRGPGEVLGTRQTGEIDFILADLQRDIGLIPKVRAYATTILSTNPKTAEQLITRWIGKREVYADA